MSGTVSAFSYETLRGLGREKDYAKVQGKLRSIGFAVPIIFLVVIPALFAVDIRLPFLFSLVVDLIGLLAVVRLACAASLTKRNRRGSGYQPCPGDEEYLTVRILALYLLQCCFGRARCRGRWFQGCLSTVDRSACHLLRCIFCCLASTRRALTLDLRLAAFVYNEAFILHLVRSSYYRANFGGGIYRVNSWCSRSTTSSFGVLPRLLRSQSKLRTRYNSQ